MKFKQYLQEVNWQRRQAYKGKPFWHYDKYELIKEPDGTFTMYDITQKGDTPNSYKKIGTYTSLKKAKDSINEAKEEAPVKYKGKYVYGDEDMLTLTPELVKQRKGKKFPLSEFPNAKFKPVLKKYSSRKGNEYYTSRLASFDGEKIIDVYHLTRSGVQGRMIFDNNPYISKKDFDYNNIIIPKGIKPKKVIKKEKPKQISSKGKSLPMSIFD